MTGAEQAREDSDFVKAVKAEAALIESLRARLSREKAKRVAAEAALREAREALRTIAHGELPAEVWEGTVSDGVEWAGKIARAVLARAGEGE